jgi:spore germination cell wall hydrolase CwlJ-like protein
MLDEDKDILARTIFGEARGEYGRQDGGLPSLIAVANVIVNRSKNKKRFGRTVRDVCLKPYQFSCWLESDPNRAVIESISDENALFKTCLNVADRTMRGSWPDLTKGSDHYHADYVTPYWAKGQRCQIKIGRHLFYRLES